MFEIDIDNETEREALLRLEQWTYGSEKPQNLSDTSLLLRIVAQLYNELEELKTHSHTVR